MRGGFFDEKESTLQSILTSLSALLLGKGAAQAVDVARPSQVTDFRRSGSTKPAFRKAKVRAQVKAARKASVRTRRGW